MDNDLDVRSAFDHLFKITSKLHQKRSFLGAKDIKNIKENLCRIDTVLQCIFSD
jgi:hypothetical protein